MSLLTVITPIYNRDKHLPFLFESLDKQKRDFEWLIVDDGSTDNTVNVVNGFISKADFKLHI